MITYNAIVHACVVIVQFSLCMDVDAVTKEALDLMGDLKEARQTGSQHELTISTTPQHDPPEHWLRPPA